MSRDDREKASDLFAKTTPLFGKKVSFAEAFPTVESATVRVTPTRSYQSDHEHVLGIGHIGEYFDCINPICYGGGFSIGAILRQMVHDGETHKQGSKLCKGYEGSPKGRRKYRKCMESFRYSVELTFKSESGEQGN